MAERYQAISVANNFSSCTSDWLIYCKLRNCVTKLNKKEKLYYEAKINYIKNVEKNALEYFKIKLLAERQIELALFITKTFDVANYFNDYFIGKVGKLRKEMPTMKS
jgi:hypothetical protein